MIRRLFGDLRLYFASAWYSYRALYAWQTLGPYLSGKVAFPIAQMLFFYFMGKLAGTADPVYIVLGHILLLPATNGVAGVSMTISGERDFRTLPYLIASPAPRGPSSWAAPWCTSSTVCSRPSWPSFSVRWSFILTSATRTCL